MVSVRHKLLRVQILSLGGYILSAKLYVLAMVTPICALPPLSDSLRESESHLNVQCWTLMFVVGACRATGGVWVSYSWVVTQMGA